MHTTDKVQCLVSLTFRRNQLISLMKRTTRGEKRRDLSPMTKAPTHTEKSKKQHDNTKTPSNNSDYTTIADRLRTRTRILLGFFIRAFWFSIDSFSMDRLTHLLIQCVVNLPFTKGKNNFLVSFPFQHPFKSTPTIFWSCFCSIAYGLYQFLCFSCHRKSRDIFYQRRF